MLHIACNKQNLSELERLEIFGRFTNYEKKKGLRELESPK